MPSDYITIPRNEYLALIREVKRGVEVCDGAGEMRLSLQALHGTLTACVNKKVSDALQRAIDSCGEVSRLRVELAALERKLRELDRELTPVRPPGRTDIEATFQASVEFARGEKKP